MLLPMYFLIGMWGGPQREYAAIKFFLYTLFGSVLMLIAMVAMFADAGTTDIAKLLVHEFSYGAFDLLGIHIVGGMQTLMFLAFFASFAVKMPMWPVHTWLPDAMEGPTPVSALIHAATMVTAGVFLVVRCSPLFEYSQFALNIVAIIGMITAVIGLIGCKLHHKNKMLTRCLKLLCSQNGLSINQRNQCISEVMLENFKMAPS